jgi:opacity protein-like surface antigen
MRKTICCVSLALLLAGAATAEDSGNLIEPWKAHPYWRIQGGWSNPDDSDVPDTILGSTSLDDTGAVGAAVGLHPFRHVRFDIFEFSWREYKIKSGPLDATVDAYTFLANVYYVPFPDLRISPFAGIGAGVIHAKGKVLGVGWDSTDFAWNARVGAEFRMNEHIGFVAEYRFVMDHGAIDDELPVHELLFGAQLRFY